jgi:hypothetical protein
MAPIIEPDDMKQTSQEPLPLVEMIKVMPREEWYHCLGKGTARWYYGGKLPTIKNYLAKSHICLTG